MNFTHFTSEDICGMIFEAFPNLGKRFTTMYNNREDNIEFISIDDIQKRFILTRIETYALLNDVNNEDDFVNAITSTTP
ncbi:hypothetical protein CMI47_13270 [Candidatus Pacearchaeota archaeon]|nr:hypothetical protein [Candidatus Pacearchaeota archaeon]